MKKLLLTIVSVIFVVAAYSQVKSVKHFYSDEKQAYEYHIEIGSLTNNEMFDGFIDQMNAHPNISRCNFLNTNNLRFCTFLSNKELSEQEIIDLGNSILKSLAASQQVVNNETSPITNTCIVKVVTQPITSTETKKQIVSSLQTHDDFVSIEFKSENCIQLVLKPNYNQESLYQIFTSQHIEVFSIESIK